MAFKDSRRVKLRNLPKQTFVDGHWTKGRRLQPVEQLKRIGNTNYPSRRYNPELVECEITDWKNNEALWDCGAELNAKVKFGETTVICEGITRKLYVLISRMGWT